MTMTVLSVIQDACVVALGIERPTSVFGNASRQQVELAALANDVARAILSEHDWQKLRQIATITGDGATEDFDLPDDFDRMPLEASLWSARLTGRFCHIADLDRWLGLEVQSFDQALNSWTIYGGQLHIKPAPAAGETVKFWYVSGKFAKTAGGVLKAAFEADTDTFRLSENLLRLGVIYRWRTNKGFPYAEQLEAFEVEKERCIARDRGPVTITQRRRVNHEGATVAYPWQLEGPQ